MCIFVLNCNLHFKLEEHVGSVILWDPTKETIFTLLQMGVGSFYTIADGVVSNRLLQLTY